MSLFQCSKCGCGEETSLCHYWAARVRGTAPICSACDPAVGKWHAEFPREPFALRYKREIECWLGQSIEIVGKLSRNQPDGLDKLNLVARPSPVAEREKLLARTGEAIE
jgi:hypothetical protein